MATNFQKRHHEALAETIRNYKPVISNGKKRVPTEAVIVDIEIANLVSTIADMLDKDNSNFNRERFIRRCGWH